MSITSLVFLLFIFLICAIYYLIPQKGQWIVLLIASLFFYIYSSSWAILFVLLTAAVIYGAARWIDALRSKQTRYLQENKATLSREEKKVYKEKNKKARRRIMIAALVLNFGVLCVFKYAHFVIDQINLLLTAVGIPALDNSFSLIAVLGISFYTFQSTGYLVDVYWDTAPVQKNFFKTLLFVSFFPQITQGPISNYGQLGPQLYAGHTFDSKRFAYGFYRIVWGIFKKMVVADCFAILVDDAFANYAGYTGLTCLCAAFGYSIQIYADFSGYMDIMCGCCELFGITLTENFLRPYFSKSIAEYWRRWHVSLGEWFKKYIYYPIGISKWNRSVGKFAQAKFGKHVGQTLPASIALVVVWLTTGLWHGASWAYIAWGGVNGLFIIFSFWMEPMYARINTSLRINSSNIYWKAFQVVRTFVLVTFIKVLPEVGTLSDGIGFISRIFTEHSIPSSFDTLLPGILDKLNFLAAVIGVAGIFAVSVLQRKKPFRDQFIKLPAVVRIATMGILILMILVFGVANDGTGGFMYAQF